MALFFILGRPIYRMSDRFKIDADVKMELDGVTRLFKTVDISEQGLCFVSEFPYLMDDERLYELMLSRDEYTAQFKGKLLRVDSGADYRYIFKIERIDEAHYQELLKILYDRAPHLPDHILDPSVYRDIERNIKSRRQKTRLFKRKFPRVNLDLTLVSTEGLLVKVVNFNYEYLLVDLNQDVVHLVFPLMTHPELSLNCTFDQMITRMIDEGEQTYTLYKIENYQDIPGLVWKEELTYWLQQKVPA